MPFISFQPILDAALADYSKQVGIDLATHPLADSFRSCASPDDVLKLLENKANQFKDFRDGNRKLLNWLSPIVQVVRTLSGVLGTSITLTASGVSSSYDALVELFECLGNFLKRLQIHTDLPFTPSMREISVKIMVELLSVLALATKQIKQGRFSPTLRREIRKEATRRKRDRRRPTQAGSSHPRGRSDDYGPDARSCLRTRE
ncbi:hypothetical protein EDB92DRAFT_2016790 [Lactarius akahatsu]|uniref:Fungal STAND N-terminal Goodbye domain-containing protein n=1 Tax=Lactarius akahatsu TaxID=416441 RepID=A0AAD4LCY8_9AGAM|nr:hypothetical protein EDB92DRAFT_2016790 [Lactarius akahatsu]